MRKLLHLPLLLADSEILQGFTHVLSGADLPTTQRALGELLGWVVVAVVLRIAAKLRERFMPAAVQVTNVVVPAALPARPLETNVLGTASLVQPSDPSL